MSRLILNIGLDHPYNPVAVQCANTFWELRLLFPDGDGDRPYKLEGRGATDDGFEATVIVDFAEAPEDWDRKVNELALYLEQDCIACWHGGAGYLLGPKPGPWQPFRFDLFVFPEECT